MNGVYWIYSDTSAPLAPMPLVPPPLTPTALAPMPLAIVLCPRGGSMLLRDLSLFKREGIETLVSLLSEEQIRMLALAEEPAVATELGMDFVFHPLPDHHLPSDIKAFRSFVNDLARRLHAGERIGVHCWGSIGRATLAAACTLIHLGWEPANALAAVESARGCPVPDTDEQKEWILAYRGSE